MTRENENVARVMVGQPVKITSVEQAHLAVLGRQMLRAAEQIDMFGESSWIVAYYKAHREAFRILQGIAARSHEAAP